MDADRADPAASPQLQRVSSLCLVRADRRDPTDCNDYSVPCEFAHYSIVVRANVSTVDIFHQDQCIATHCRCHKKEKAVYKPWHYVASLSS